MPEVSIPEELVDYFQSHIELFLNYFRRQTFRFISASESAYWVAYEGFDLKKKTDCPKLSASLSPILYLNYLPELKAGFIRFSEQFFEEARAASYTYSYDPITDDMLAKHELEFAIYYSPTRGYNKSFVDINVADVARLLRNVSVDATDYKKAKTLPYYLHGRVYARYAYTLMPEYLLIKHVAMINVLHEDTKMSCAFGYAWDKYWEGYNKLETAPNYGNALYCYAINNFVTSYDMSSIHWMCVRSAVSDYACRRILNDVITEMRNIYGIVGASLSITDYHGYSTSSIAAASEKGYRLYNMFPDLLESPQQADTMIKWWFGDFDSLVMYLKNYRLRLYEPRVTAEQDPEVFVEDGGVI